jgi:hypothetical protein
MLGFRRTADEEGMRQLFEIDTSEELALVEHLDLGLLESSVEHAEDRLTANALVYATAGGAVAGAVVASILAAAA